MIPKYIYLNEQHLLDLVDPHHGTDRYKIEKMPLKEVDHSKFRYDRPGYRDDHGAVTNCVCLECTLKRKDPAE